MKFKAKKPDWRTWLTSKTECKKWHDYYRKRGMLKRTAFRPENYMKKWGFSKSSNACYKYI